MLYELLWNTIDVNQTKYPSYLCELIWKMVQSEFICKLFGPLIPTKYWSFGQGGACTGCWLNMSSSSCIYNAIQSPLRCMTGILAGKKTSWTHSCWGRGVPSFGEDGWLGKPFPALTFFLHQFLYKLSQISIIVQEKAELNWQVCTSRQFSKPQDFCP